MNKWLLILFAGILMTACQEKETMIEITTDYGVMKAKLYDSTPKHKENMIKLIEEGFYDDLLFHRVINGFMIQGGDPESRNAPPQKQLGAGGPGYQIDAEIGALHFKGTLAAARTGDGANPQRRSSGSQFYIVQGRPVSESQLDLIAKQNGTTYTPEQIEKYKTEGGTPFLDNQYTVFGEVVEGLDVIDKIAAVRTAPGDRPVEDVKMKIRILK
jgi:peptidyl-prolyl cis-trans isomerase B (cyclophilin B)